MPRLLLCGFESFPGAPVNPAAAVVRRLQSKAWRAGGIDTDLLTIPVAWSGSVEAVRTHLAARPAEAILAVGVAVTADVFRVETQGRNAASCTTPDSAGVCWPEGAPLADGPAIARATSPCPAMVDAIAALGLPVEASDHAGDYLCNFTLYRLLHEQAAPMVGFLHIPQARECDPAAVFPLDQIEAAVQAAAEAVACAALGAVR